MLEKDNERVVLTKKRETLDMELKMEESNEENSTADQPLQLNVGGIYFPMVFKKVLTSVPDSVLKTMFSDDEELTKVNGKIFVDRDPKMFEHLINYLRNGREWVEFDSHQENKQFRNELSFWEIEAPLSKFSQKLVDLMTSEPNAFLSPDLLTKW